jgi:DNA-binding NarL/FixJ family response regulator
VRILILDGNHDVRSALRLYLESECDVEVVGEIGHAAELETALRLMAPDALLLDWELRDLDSALAAVTRLGRSSQPAVVAVSSYPERRHAALASGAIAFVSKFGPSDELRRAITAVGRTPRIGGPLPTGHEPVTITGIDDRAPVDLVDRS